MLFGRWPTAHVALLFLAFLGGCGRQASSEEPVGEVLSALTGARAFSLALPSGVSPDQTVLSANGQNGQLQIQDFASVTSSSTGTLAVNTSGGLLNATQLGNQTTTVGVDSVGSVQLLNNTVVDGSVVSSGNITESLGDFVSGSVTPNATLTPLFPVTWTATPPSTNAGNINVLAGTTTTLAPGAYGNVFVLTGGQLTLTPGSYFFEQLQVSPQATLLVQHQGQPVLVYVASVLLWQGAVEDSGDATHLLIGFNGTLAPLQSAFRGTVVAPGAQVQLFQNSVPHVGSFFGQSVQVTPHTSVQFAAYAHWGLFVAPILSVTCVIEYTPTNFGALFGYTNLLQTPFTVADGPSNQFAPAVPNFVPTTTFAPGTHTGVTGVPMPGSSETWQVRNMSVQATRATLPTCTGDETRIARQTPLNAVDPDRAGPASPAALSGIVPYTP
jgi:hypothetical protein